jgi:hypothetical protein
VAIIFVKIIKKPGGTTIHAIPYRPGFKILEFCIGKIVLYWKTKSCFPIRKRDTDSFNILANLDMKSGRELIEAHGNVVDIS